MALTLLLASTVGVPALAIVLLAILEAMGAPVTASQQFKRVGHDLCILSIGIAGSMFGNVKIGAAIEPVRAAVVSIVVVLVNLILSAVVILVDARSRTWGDAGKATLSIFLGVISVAIPTGVIIYIAGLI